MTTPTTPEFYEIMRTIREFENALLADFSAGLLNGTTHTSIGQEHIAAAVLTALDRKRDVVFSNHRCHGHFIAYSDDVEALARELMGREGAINAGIGGSQHIQYRNFYTNGVQGGIVANAVGAALAEKRAGRDTVTTVFVGDGTLGEGIVYEALNLAALWSVRLLIILENNQYAQSTPTRTTTAGDIVRRFDAFGIAAIRSSSSDPRVLFEAVSEILDTMRAIPQPRAMIVDTYRLGPHSKSDDTRDPEEIAQYRAADPLERLGASLDVAARHAVDAQVAARIAHAFESARGAAPSTWSLPA